MNHTQASVCDGCPARYYCVNKDRADPCPVGRYCPGNTGFNQSLCPAGTYNPTEMLMDETECTQCDGGSYCEVPGLWNVSGPCNGGYYCQSGVNTAAPSNNNTGFGGKYTYNMLVQYSFTVVTYNMLVQYSFTVVTYNMLVQYSFTVVILIICWFNTVLQ